MYFAAHEMKLGPCLDNRDAWFETLRRNHGLTCRFEPQQSQGSSVKTWALGDVSIARADLQSLRLAPVGEELSSWQGEWLFVKIVTSGWLFFEQFGYQQRFEAGSFFIVDPAQPFVEYVPQRTQMTVLRIAKTKLVARGCGIHAQTPITPDLGSADVQATRDLIQCIIGQSDAPSLGLRTLLGEQLLDLVSLTLATPQACAKPRHPLTALFRAKRFIQQHLCNEQLTMTDVADACHVSAKHLQRLFREEGTSLMRYLWERRLEKAHGLLRDRTGVITTIQDVAWQCGFSSAAHFSRVFKEAYGVSPTDFRRGAAIIVA